MLRNPAGKGKVGILVVSPTRELTAQIAVEAQQICTFHNLVVQVMLTQTLKKHHRHIQHLTHVSLANCIIEASVNTECNLRSSYAMASLKEMVTICAAYRVDFQELFLL